MTECDECGGTGIFYFTKDNKREDSQPCGKCYPEWLEAIRLKKRVEDAIKELQDDLEKADYLNEDGKQFARQYRVNLQLLLKGV